MEAVADRLQEDVEVDWIGAKVRHDGNVMGWGKG